MQLKSWLETGLPGRLVSLKIGRLLGRAALVLSWAEFWQFLIVVCYHRIGCFKASKIFGTNQCKQAAAVQCYINAFKGKPPMQRQEGIAEIRTRQGT